MLFENLTEVLDPEPHSAAMNMAVDEVLLRLASGPLLRVYRWERPAISFGYFEKFATVEGLGAQRELTRRWTGGGVVWHGEDLTYTIIVPANHVFSRLPAPESYRQIHGCIAEALGACGIQVKLAASAAEKISNGCFQNAVEADVVAGTQKIAGAAQRRTRWGLLHQGSIQGIDAAARLEEGLASVFATAMARRPLATDEMEQAEELSRQKYGTEAWLRKL